MGWSPTTANLIFSILAGVGVITFAIVVTTEVLRKLARGLYLLTHPRMVREAGRSAQDEWPVVEGTARRGASYSRAEDAAGAITVYRERKARGN